MATYSAPAARLLTLCENGEHEQLLSLLQDNATLRTVFSREAVDNYPNTIFAGVTQEYLIFERMLAAASRGGQVDLLSALLDFGQRHGVAAPYMVTTGVVSAALHQVTDSLGLLLALQRVEPEVFSIRLPMGHHILETVCLGSKREPRVRLPLLRHMMDMGIDPNMRLYLHGNKPGVLLYKASRFACVEMVECLLQHGAIIAKSKAQRAAARFGRVDVLEALLRYGADLNECSEAKDMDGPAGAALHVAAANSQAEAVRWLVENGADSMQENCNRLTPRNLLSKEINKII
ncbi:ankyrin [Trematosphaeria pertusa]|uniref:Ankyrin n=1 Tax=Trematosphaeria pertusa TaxID=390896 RepID=A0A6A6J3L6_9PLEO|nr:ankyrin [Trematosphaeria pertusa]KAF2256073.1 ankyrin [Trematosphaeria pertusa]